MDVIQAARELGKAIQADDRYIAMSLASQKSEEDKELQEMIADFNRQRTALNQELQKEERDADKIKEMDGSIKGLYNTIFQNPNMIAFNEARGEMEQMIGFVNQIISGSTQGQDPQTIEYQESCGGDCGGCSGCS